MINLEDELRNIKVSKKHNRREDILIQISSSSYLVDSNGENLRFASDKLPISWHPNGDMFLAYDFNNKNKYSIIFEVYPEIKEVNTGKLLSAFAYSPKGNLTAEIESHGIKITDKQKKSIIIPSKKEFVFSPDEEYILTSESFLGDKNIIYELPLQEGKFYGENIRSMREIENIGFFHWLDNTNIIVSPSFENSYILDIFNGDKRELINAPAMVNVEVSPDKQFILFCDFNSECLRVVDYKNDKNVLTIYDTQAYFSWAPDSRRIAFTRYENKDFQVYITDLRGDEMKIAKGVVRGWRPK